MYVNLSSCGNAFRPFPRQPFEVARAIPERAIPHWLAGVTKDNSGVVLPGCTCHLFKWNGAAAPTWLGSTVSDGAGNYRFDFWVENAADKFVASWKDSNPHVFDVTDHVLQPN